MIKPVKSYGCNISACNGMYGGEVEPGTSQTNEAVYSLIKPYCHEWFM
jgi:hypothetical protein